MNRLPIILTLVVAAFSLTVTGCGGNKNKTPNKKGPKELPAEVAMKYREDAARLTARELLSNTQTGELGAELPKDRQAYFYNLLAEIYWMMKKSDTIPDMSHIHTFPDPDLHKVIVILEKDSPFKENWSQGATSTTNLYLNQLISRHKLKIKNYRDGALGPTMIMESPDFVNTKELAFLLTNVDGIRHSESEGVAGDGDNITYGPDGKNQMAIKISRGAGDCPSGCIHRKEWIFYVGEDGSVRYMGTRGSIPKEFDGEE